MPCEHLKQSPVGPYDEWCELHPQAKYPPCKNGGHCDKDKEKKYNSTTNKYE